VNVAEAKRVGDIDENDVDVAREPSVLEAIIEKKNIYVGIIPQDLPAASTRSPWE